MRIPVGWKYKWLAALIGTFQTISCLVWAQTPKQELKHGMTDIEIAMLPDYCRARVAGDQETKKAWSQRMGNDKWIHLHHYCMGLNAYKQAQVTIDSKKRANYLKFALGQFNYVLGSWPADFELAREAQRMKMMVIAMSGGKL